MVLLLLTFFALYSTLNIAEFEQINVGWVWENIFPDNKFWHAGLLHKLKSYGISGQLFGLIFYFLSNRWPWVVLDEKSSQEYPVNDARVLHGSILGPTLFLLYISDPPHDVTCNIALYADDTSLYSKCD